MNEVKAPNAPATSAALNGIHAKQETSRPHITVFDGRGKHNADLDQTTIDLDMAGAWREHQTVCIIPSAAKVFTKTALSWMHLVKPPNQPFITFNAQGMEVGAAYSAAIEEIIANPILSKWKYILTIEHDNIPEPDGFIKLLRAMDDHPEYAAISGLYFTKGYGGVAQIWGDARDPVTNYRPCPPRLGEVVECCGIGMGFALWRMEMFKDPEIARPLFETKMSREAVGTQDLAFWDKARARGYRCAVDCRIPVGHIAEDGEVF